VLPGVERRGGPLATASLELAAQAIGERGEARGPGTTAAARSSSSMAMRDRARMSYQLSFGQSA